jgi:hypothetical protein
VILYPATGHPWPSEHSADLVLLLLELDSEVGYLLS